MTGLTYSAIGTANIQGLSYMKLNPAKIQPGMLMSGDDEAAPSADVIKSESATPVGEQIRSSLLDEMGLSENDLKVMKPETRTDLETHIAKRIHEQIMASPNPEPGSLINATA